MFRSQSPACDQWILPVIQGYVHLSQIAVEPPDANPLNADPGGNTSSCDETFTLGLISRRSRYQAGTRWVFFIDEYNIVGTGNQYLQLKLKSNVCLSLFFYSFFFRYNRRGIEPGGKVANYVETEQIVSLICTDSIHRASFVQVIVIWIYTLCTVQTSSSFFYFPFFENA